MPPVQERSRDRCDDRMWRQLFRQLPQPLLLVDPTGNIRDFNTAAQSLFGLGSPAATMQRKVDEILQGDGGGSLAGLLLSAARLPAGEVRTVRLYCHATAARDCMAQVFALPAEPGSESCIVLQLIEQDSHAALQRSETRFRLTQEVTQSGMWDWDIGEDQIDLDPMCWRLLGISERQQPLSYDSWRTLLHPDDLAEVESTYRQQLERGERFVTLGRYRKTDGSWVWIRAVGQVVEHDENGAPLRMLGTLTDVDAERKAQLQSEHLLAQLHQLSAAMPGVIFQFHSRPDGRSALPYASDNIGRLTGLKAASLHEDARLLFEHVHPDDLADLQQAIAEARQQLSQFRHAFRLIRPEGQLVWIGVTAMPVRQADGSVIFHGYAADISERKALEQALELRRQRLDNLIWGTGAGTWEWNVQSGESRINEAWAGMLGYALAELEPISRERFVELLHPDDRDRVDAEMQRHLQGETACLECEFRMQHRDGHWIWALDRGRVCSWTADGKPEWMMGIHLDISRRKTAEVELERLAHYDNLTGLARRPLLNEHIRQAISQARRHAHQIALLFLDLDGFKQINDVHGHAAGDALLIALAHRMRSCLREVDTVARIGGDELTCHRWRRCADRCSACSGRPGWWPTSACG
jgi:PAS domain S-box-containing protein